MSGLTVLAQEPGTWPPQSPTAILSAARALPPAGQLPTLPAAAAIEPIHAKGRWESAPNPTLTPGILCTASDKDYTERRYPEQIAYCRRNLSTDEKKVVSRRYGVPWDQHHLYQFDHLLSLCLGGSNDLRNIWPMPYADARAKAKLEFQLCERLKRAEVTQEQAVREELSWVAESIRIRAAASSSR
ncbi:MAG: hypothetical protein HYZ75_19605 [Elusimicrobia bacterium]|nr:hypothetical protein [Elusimicrobiota bacterium]